MILRRLYFFLSFIGLLWFSLATFVVWISRDDPPLLISAVFLITFPMATGLPWIGFTAYLMYRVVPKIDALVDPDTCNFIRRTGDYQAYRIHRLTAYTLSIESARYHRRATPHLDFSGLGREFTIPLRVHSWWMSIALGSAVAGWAAFEIAEYLGYIEAL